MLHQRGHLLRGGRGAGADAGDHRADDREAVAVGEVAEALVVGYQQAALRRNGRHLRLDPAVQLLQPGDVSCGVGCVGLLARRILDAQAVPDVLHVFDGRHRVEPEMWVPLMLVGVFPFGRWGSAGGRFLFGLMLVDHLARGRLAHGQAGRSCDDGLSAAGVRQHAIQPRFEPRAVDDQHLAGSDFRHILRGGLEHVRVNADGDQGVNP